MSEIKRIIIEANGNWPMQIQAADAAIKAEIGVGEIIGICMRGWYFGVKRNKASVRVYPQEPR